MSELSSQDNEAVLRLTLQKLADSPEVAAAFQDYTREKIRDGAWFAAFCRPWLLSHMAHAVGEGPPPGPMPRRYPPPGWKAGDPYPAPSEAPS